MGSQVPQGTRDAVRSVGDIPSPYLLRVPLLRGSDTYSLHWDRDGVEIQPSQKSGAQDSSDASEPSDNSQLPYQQLALDFDKLPQPSVLGSFIGGVTQQTMRRNVLMNAVTITPMMLKFVGRPPTQEEMDLLATYTAEGIQTGSRGPFIGTVAGLAQQLRTARTGQWNLPLPFRMPFTYPRGAEFNPQIFKIGARELLKGQAAYFAHKTIRMSLYATAGYMLGQVYLNINFNAAAFRAAADPKLAALKRATDAVFQQHREEVMQRMGVKQPDQASKGTRTGSGGDSAVMSRIPAAAKTASTSDDASPTGGMGAWDDTNVEPDDLRENRSAETALDSENSPGSDRFAENKDQPTRHPRQHQGSFEKLQRQSINGPDQMGDGDDDFFSQSSSAPRTQDPDSLRPQPAAGSWDRLRRGAPPPATRKVAKQSPADDGQSPIAREATDEKSQAQKEFDAMLERERAGDEPKRGSRW